MIVVDFCAESHLVGRRIRISWKFVMGPLETPVNAPRITLRRKLRDWEFPAPVAIDPFTIYDSQAFPSAGSTVLELPVRQDRIGEQYLIKTATSIAANINGSLTEVARRTLITRLDANRIPLDQTVEYLDYGTLPQGLTPGVPLYYELTIAGSPDVNRAAVSPTEVYGLGKKLYELLPGIHRAHDTVLAPQDPSTQHLIEGLQRTGQLRRFLDLFGVALDSMRSTAEGLRNLRDVDNSDYRYLPLMAQWIGWNLSYSASIPAQRHEVKYAPALYRIAGTIPGCQIWVYRLTGWQPRLKEFARNVFLTNHMPDPNDPGDNGSKTVNTRDAAAITAIGRFEDSVDYIYDSGVSQKDCYAFNVVGIFVKALPTDSAAETQRKRDRLVNNMSIFLPSNMRGIVITE